MNDRLDLTISVVTYNDSYGCVSKLLNCLTNAGLKKRIIVIDNSTDNKLEEVCNSYQTDYIFNKKNMGFGAGHNIALRKNIDMSKYHLIVNPDIYFSEGTLEKIFYFMEQNPDIGLIMPKVLYPDNSLQYLCRLLPSPRDLILRRVDLKFLRSFCRKSNNRYELRFADYDKIMDVPYLSGCFMFTRTEVFNKAGLFDERFFLYLEDIDLSRRINKYYRTVYYPRAVICHGYHKGSYKNPRLLFQHAISAIKYFNKWGWILDKEREIVNRKTLHSFCISS